MGAKDYDAAGRNNKRKLSDRTKVKESKKPKFEKRPQAEEDFEDFDEDDQGEEFLDDAEDGGALVNNHRTQANDRKPNGSRSNDAAGAQAFEKGQNSREAHQKQKQLAAERKASKPLADESQRVKKLWERLRRKSHVPKEERDKLVEELFSIVTGRIKEFALKHDTVRVVQTAIKYSNVERRRMIAKELKGAYSQLAESKYAKFLIGKLLSEREPEIRDIIVPEFFGKVRKLINHPEASWILDDVYRGVATKDQKAIMLREWYGPEFAIFRSAGDKAGTAELSEILKDEPSKRSVIMRYLKDMTNQLIQKKLTGFTMLHDGMLQYYLNTQPGSEEAKEFLEVIKEDENGDLLKNMGFTSSGARLVCLLLAYGNAKDRKHLLKVYKNTFQLMASDPYGHMIILAAYDLIDDTVATSKAIFPELVGKSETSEVDNLVIIANDPNARLTIRYLFEGASKALFDASHATDLSILGEIHEIRKTTSKKEPETRRQELIAALSPSLLSAIESSPADLTATSFGCQLVTEALLSAVGDKSEALKALANTAEGNLISAMETEADEQSEAEPSVHFAKTPHGGRMFKTLVQGGRYDKATNQIKPVEPPLGFADILYPAIKDHVTSWATGPSSFVIVSLLEANDFSHADELKKALKKDKKILEKAANEETPEQKASREVAEAAPKAEKPGKKANKGGPNKPRAVGNVGTKLLLEKL